MKTIMENWGCQISISPIFSEKSSGRAGARRSGPAGRRRSQEAFTLIELLVVIAIIGIVASLSLVAIAKVREQGRKEEARREIRALFNAVGEYNKDTGRYPVSSGAVQTAGAGDFTYGGASLDAVFGAPGIYSVNNSEVIAILMDRERYQDGTPTVNLGHIKNTRQKNYLASVPMADTTSQPGLGPDLVFRDPWGNPYIITFDLNSDENCRDALYAISKVSQDKAATGFNGLLNSKDATGVSDDFQYRGGVMIWSLGPDRRADKNGPANAGANRDNILSWQ